MQFRHLPVLSHEDTTHNLEQLQGILKETEQALVQIQNPRSIEAWKGIEALGFTNAWKNFEAGRKAEYRRNTFGTVELRGVISGGESAKAAFTLPVGYRPKEAKSFLVDAATNTGLIEVLSTGVVTPSTIAGEVKTFCFLDQVSFSVE